METKGAPSLDELVNIGGGYMRDRFGSFWCLSPKRGLVRVPSTSRGLRNAQVLNVLIRNRNKRRGLVMSIAKRLGHWAESEVQMYGFFA